MNTLTELNTFSATTVAADDERLASPGTTNFTRYEINGVVDPNKNVMSNIESLANSAATWITYDTSTGKWTCVINQSGSATKSFSDSNIIGELKVTNTSLDNYFNSVEVEFPHKDLNDASDYIRIDIPAVDRKPNEPDNVLKLNYPLVNEQVQAQLLGFIELKQSRVDTVIEFTTDFTAIDLQAGDLIDVTNSTFGYTNKVFRVLQVKEVDNETLSLEITAMEYDANVYSTSDLVRYVRSNADGIITIGDIGKCGTPQITKTETDRVPHFLLETSVPDNTDPANPYGIVEGIEVWIYEVPAGELPTWQTVDDESRTYTLLTTIKPQGEVFAPGADIDYNIYNLDASNFLLKVRGVNSVTKGPFSDLSGLVQYTPKQVTDQITNDTEINDGGSILASLGMSVLMRLLNGLLQNGDSGAGSLFRKIFDTFEDVTGVDLIGDASGGSLVVAANVAVKDESIQLTSQTSSLNFVGDSVTATATGNDVTVTIDTSVSSPGPTLEDNTLPATALVATATLPPDRGTHAEPILGTDSDNSDRAPATGSYYITFVTNNGSKIYSSLSAGSGNAYLYKSDGTLVETLPVSSATITGRVVELPFANRSLGTDYYILVDDGFVTYCGYSSAGLNKEFAWNFNTHVVDVSAYTTPTAAADVLSVSSVSGISCAGGDITISFSDNVSLGSGNIVITNTTTSTVLKTIVISNGTASGSTITIPDPGIVFDPSSTYSYTIPTGAGVTTDCSSANSSSRTYSYTSPAKPTLVDVYYNSYPVTGNEYSTNDTKVAPQSNIKVVYDSNIQLNTTGTIQIGSHQTIDLSDTFSADRVSELVWVEGTDLYINPTVDFTAGDTHTLTISAGAVKNSCGTGADAISESFTVDAGPSTASTPDFQNDEVVQLDYDRELNLGTGNIEIIDTDGSTVLYTVPTSDPSVSVETITT